MEDTAAKVKKMIVEKLGINEQEITEGSSFKEDFLIDSLDLYELFQETEKLFDITIPDEEAKKIDTVGKLTAYISHQKH